MSTKNRFNLPEKFRTAQDSALVFEGWNSPASNFSLNFKQSLLLSKYFIHCWGQLDSNELRNFLHLETSSVFSSKHFQYSSRAPQQACLSFIDGAAIPSGLKRQADLSARPEAGPFGAGGRKRSRSPTTGGEGRGESARARARA